ncbi:hypothetical protein PtrSN002B_004976 [Pyrenophora tritici-repentis]|nr:uncharacterized protein PTRG_07901 [Pyrenophora tritici-repentis Pt-1C-BFP]KAA8616760.1 hypothetical protein PtrV1_10061 [Pyrenophora tritici-repentis]EDU50820.1 hypothetical protein PTRG_07901 [Pyrenophora tritici-repentis Pt-1C-BFP]KAF7567157.1 Tymo-45kd-70kd domain containing protein [Pyrenophora tritici-repentis]KAI1539050.1 hypothetical protein PtrSN001A_004730 [Pyrenophora tritici-repentis]KAI1540967.1 hypothetical protein PtrSN001C_004696 [Pyrenophora tritici-repentis]
MTPSDKMPLTSDNVVKLDRLTIRYKLTSAAHLLYEPDCLSHFGPYLKHLVIANAYRGNWNQFFQSLEKIHPESLSIVV